MKNQIVYPLSTNYAGSHYLSLMLSSNSSCASVGEFKTFLHLERQGRYACLTCEDDERCPVFKGIPYGSTDAPYEVLFRNLAEIDPLINTAIDFSKSTNWAGRSLASEGFTQRYIHLIRDPRALLRRWMTREPTKSEMRQIRWDTARRCMKSLNLAKRAGPVLFGTDEQTFLYKWLVANKRIVKFIKDNKLEARTVTYHDLATAPEKTIKDLMEWLGLTFEPEQIDFWKFEHHGSMKQRHLKKGESGPRFHDKRWQEYLSEKVKKDFSENTDVKNFLDELGLVMTDDGLTQRSEFPNSTVD